MGSNIEESWENSDAASEVSPDEVSQSLSGSKGSMKFRRPKQKTQRSSFMHLLQVLYLVRPTARPHSRRHSKLPAAIALQRKQTPNILQYEASLVHPADPLEPAHRQRQQLAKMLYRTNCHPAQQQSTLPGNAPTKSWTPPEHMQGWTSGSFNAPRMCEDEREQNAGTRVWNISDNKPATKTGLTKIHGVKPESPNHLNMTPQDHAKKLLPTSPLHLCNRKADR